ASIDRRIGRLPRPAALYVAIPIAALAVFLWRPDGFWENNLSKLTPVPPQLLKRDAQPPKGLATPDLRSLLVASGDSEDGVLSALEGLEAPLHGAVQDGAIGSF